MAINSYNQKTKSTTVNPYFNFITANSEQELYDALTVENIKMTGTEVFFSPREFVEIDKIFKEPFKSTFTTAYKIEAYVKDADWSSGAGDALSKFGFQQQDAVNLIISRTAFSRLKIDSRSRPVEGDMIFIGDANIAQGYGSYPNSVFEITYVENEIPHWQVGKWMFYDVTCKLFSYGYETMDTKIPALDTIPDGFSNDGDVIAGVNNDMMEIKQSLLNFDETNPFSDL